MIMGKTGVSALPVTQMSLHLRAMRIAVAQSAGTGLPIVLLHGSGSSKAVFVNQLSGPLAEAYRVVAIDLPGHGASDDSRDPEADYTVTGLADLVADVSETLGLGPALVVGWSAGGHVAFEMMHRQPHLVAGVVVTGAPPLSRNPLALLRGFHTRWDMLLAGKPNFSTHDAERFARLCFGPDLEDYHLAAIVRADGRMRSHFGASLLRGDGADQRHIVETSPIPLALVNGEHEPMVRLSYLDAIDYANLWEGRPHVIAGAAHAPFLTHPNAYNALLHRFAAEIGLRTSRPTPEAAPVADSVTRSEAG